MSAIVESIEIGRRPEDVFSYVTDASHLSEWQESVVSVERDEQVPESVHWRGVVTRQVGPRRIPMRVEVTAENPPNGWLVRGLDGPVRGMVTGAIERLDEGERSRVTITLDFKAYGIGKLLLPLVVRRQARAEMPKNMRRLKQRLEWGAS
jgi:uncharacterized protein YndB with AHSA1/START domain